MGSGMLNFYTDDPSSNPAVAYNFYPVKLFKTINQNELFLSCKIV